MKKQASSLNIKTKLNPGDWAKYASISLYFLAGICFMIYTTQQSYTFADNNDEDLGYDIASANASVTVGTACTLTSTITSPHTATIANGINSTDIGTTVLNTTCNDTGGYALYAIGYSGDTYGATDLTYTSLDGTTTNSNYNIATGTATSGSTSNWSMKLSPVAGTTAATIDNNYDSYNIVPDDYTLVATLNTVTDPGSSTAGSSVSTTYQAYISPTQPAGTYSGKVKYTLVHPSTAPAPSFMQNTAKIKSLLINEGDTMQAIDKRDGKKYWITKLADGNIWMTQNLDLDINANKTYTSADTDLLEGTTWKPISSTHTDGTWAELLTAPESYDPGNRYWDGRIINNGGNIESNTTTSGDAHYHIGNYYNWNAAIATNDSSIYSSDDEAAMNSICPTGWKLPSYDGNGSYGGLVASQHLTAGPNGNIQSPPTYFVYGGGILNGSPEVIGERGYYWYNLSVNNNRAVRFMFHYSGAMSYYSYMFRSSGLPIRCVMR